MVRVRSDWLVLLPLSTWLLGCDGPKCEPITACDIRSERCQRESLKLAACLRGAPADSQVQVEVLDYDTYVEEQVRDAIEQEPTQDEIDLREGLSRFELSVPLDREGDARRDIAWVGAFYDSQDDRVTVLDRGTSGPATERGQTILLVHEMAHALQGADGLLEAVFDPVITYDALVAAQALVEGEATLVEDQAVIEALGFDFEDSRYGRALRAYRERSQELMYEAEDLFVGLRSGIPYAFGASFLYEAFREGGASAVADRLSQPIESTRELLGLAQVQSKVRPPVPQREGASLVGSYHLGGFFFDAFLHRLDATAPDLRAHVVDDVFSVQRLTDGKLLSAWRIRFDDSIDVSELLPFISQSSIPYRAGSDDAQDLWLLREPDDSVSGEPPSFVAAPAMDIGFTAPTKSQRVIQCGHPRGIP